MHTGPLGEVTRVPGPVALETWGPGSWGYSGWGQPGSCGSPVIPAPGAPFAICLCSVTLVRTGQSEIAGPPQVTSSILSLATKQQLTGQAEGAGGAGAAGPERPALSWLLCRRERLKQCLRAGGAQGNVTRAPSTRAVSPYCSCALVAALRSACWTSTGQRVEFISQIGG